MWASLERIAAPTLAIGGGPDSHIPQDKLREVASRIPVCEMVTITCAPPTLVDSARPSLTGWPDRYETPAPLIQCAGALLRHGMIALTVRVGRR